MKAMLWAAALLATPALAQGAPMPVCVRQTPVAGFEQWGRGPATSGLVVGRPASLRLAPAAKVAFSPPLARAPADGSYGGSFTLHVDQPDYYRIALGAGAWIDVIQSGRPLSSAAHMHGPACSGIGKIVTFQLAPGDYVVQLSEARADAILAMVVSGYGPKAAGQSS